MDINQLKEAFDFLNSIEGAGYGGMATFENVRTSIKKDYLAACRRGQLPPKDGANEFCHIDIGPMLDGRRIRITFVTPRDLPEEDLFAFWLDRGQALLFSQLLAVAAGLDTDDSFQMNHVRIKL